MFTLIETPTETYRKIQYSFSIEEDGVEFFGVIIGTLGEDEVYTEYAIERNDLAPNTEGKEIIEYMHSKNLL